MDLLEFDPEPLYFDDPLPAGAARLIDEAALLYPAPDAEGKLLDAERLAPRHLAVIVALYRYYFYRNRLADALRIAGRALDVSGAPAGFPADWRALTPEHVARGLAGSPANARFWLLALKAAAVVSLRGGDVRAGIAMLEKLIGIDAHDRLGAKPLLEVAEARAREARGGAANDPVAP